MILIRVCCKCGKYLGYDDCDGPTPASVTHGFCASCMAVYRRENDISAEHVEPGEGIWVQTPDGWNNYVDVCEECRKAPADGTFNDRRLCVECFHNTQCSA